MSILVVGSIAYDTVATPSGQVEDALGGSATFFASAARFFSPVKMVAVVGEDFDAAELEFLRTQGVDTSGISVESGKTFRWSGSYGQELGDAETLATHLNVFENFRPAVPEASRGEDFVFLANIDPELQLSVLEQMSRPKMVVCDTMNFWIDGKRDALLRLLQRVDVLLLNETEAKSLAGERNVVRAARAIGGMGPSRVVVKMGEHGVLFAEGDRLLRLPAYPLEEVRDPTGAGDTFAGGFVGSLAESGDFSPGGVKRALLYGAVTASFAVEAFSMERLVELNRAEIDARYATLRRIGGWDG